MRWEKWIAAGLIVFVLCTFDVALAQASTTIRFDNLEEEAGITPFGTSDFSFLGSNWSGGVVNTRRIPPLYASGAFSYEIGVDGGVVTFDNPVDSVEFFFVHGFGFTEGTATAFSNTGNPVASISSNQATSFGDPNNFVSLDPEGLMVRLEFSGGVIDNFTFTKPAPAPGSFVRGDSDSNGKIELTDGIVTLTFLFADSNTKPLCFDAADVDDDGKLSITDGIRTFQWLFVDPTQIPMPPSPSPGLAVYEKQDCGQDPSPEEPDLGCETLAATCQ